MRKQALTLGQAFGQVVVKHRKKLKWAQIDLAEASGWGKRFIGSVERGKQNPGLAAMEDIAEALGVPIERLLSQAARLKRKSHS